MKKKIFLPMVAVIVVVAFMSCDSKTCYCYDNGREEVLYVNPDVKCSAYNTDLRGCVESNERMNPNEIGQQYKKR